MLNACAYKMVFRKLNLWKKAIFESHFHISSKKKNYVGKEMQQSTTCLAHIPILYTFIQFRIFPICDDVMYDIEFLFNLRQYRFYIFYYRINLKSIIKLKLYWHF